MGKKVPNSGAELSRDTSGNLHALFYYGGDTTNTAHTVPTDAQGNDKYVTLPLFEAVVLAARADVELDADGAVLEKALKGDNMPPEVGTWWDNMPTAFQNVLPDNLEAMFAWKFVG